MRIPLYGNIRIKENESIEDFREKLLHWVQENEWELEEEGMLSNTFNFNTQRAQHSAIFHEDYPRVNKRYFLQRIWNVNKLKVASIMTNPSSASELSGDKTVDFLVDYLKQDRFEYGSLAVVNLSPVIQGSNVNSGHFPFDDRNVGFIENVLHYADIIILGWGGDGKKYGLPQIVEILHPLLINNLQKLRVFGLSSDGSFPKHPSPQRQDQRFTLESKLSPLTLVQLAKIMS